MENESPFVWLGGWTCLDFVNTEKMRQGQRVDLLADADTLLLWMTEAHLVSGAEATEITEAFRRSPAEATEALQEARRFRGALREMAREIVDNNAISNDTLAAINARLAGRVGSYQIYRKDDNLFEEWFVEEPSDGAARYLLGKLAQAAGDLLCHADLSLIRRCENPNCILYFYDTTKNHTRRWCSMTGCGNRAKVAAHYRKKKGTPAP